MSEIHIDFRADKIRGTKGAVEVTMGDDPIFVDRLDISSDKHRKGFIKGLLADHEGLEEYKEEIERQLREVASGQLELQRCAETSPIDDPQDNQPIILSKKALATTKDELVKFAKEFLLLPDLAVRIVHHVQELGVAGEDELILTLYVLGTSRLLSLPLAGIVMGASSAGKSFVISRVANLFPDETCLQAHRITPRALEHMPQDSLVHRFIVGGERSRLQDDAAAEGGRAIREMISDGKLSLAMPVKGKSGRFETVHIEQDGPIAYVESTTLGIRDIFDEDRTRFILLASDEGPQQTCSVLRKLAIQAERPGDPDRTDSIIALHHTAQRLLEPYDVEVPYARQLIGFLPKSRLEVRRTFGHLLSFVKAVCLLHQFQRKRNAQGQLIATLEDYDVVRKHLSGPLARSLGCSLTPGATHLLEVAATCATFTVADMAAKGQCSENTARSRIRELVSARQCDRIQESSGQNPALYKVADNPPTMNGLLLPDLSHAGAEKTVVMVP